MSRIASPDTIGTASALISFATIFATISTLGIPSGVQRFIGKINSGVEHGTIAEYVKAAVLWLTIGAVACGVSMYALNKLTGNFLNFDTRLIEIGILYVASFSFTTLLRSVMISILRTRILPVIMIVSTVVKIGISAILVMIGFGALGITIGFTAFSVVASVSLAIILIPMLSYKNRSHSVNISTASKEIILASAASWIPSVIYTLGAHLGPVFVFGSKGAAEAGVYFMAFAIALAVSSMMQVLFSIAFPVLSGMKDGRKRMTWQVIKLTLVLSMPLSIAMIFYSGDIMSLFGAGYKDGSGPLGVLLVSVLPVALATGISTLAYAYGNYRQVLAIGIASNLPRAVLYMILLPVFGSFGAALSYTIGSASGLIVSLIISRKLGMKMRLRDIVSISAVPVAIGYAISLTHIQFVVGLLATLSVTYIILIKIRILSRKDIQYILGLLPKKLSKVGFDVHNEEAA